MEKTWYKSYEAGVPHAVETHEYESILDLLEYSFKKFAQRPAFHGMGKTFSFSEMEELSRNFACFLQNDLKLGKGDRVAILSPNILQYPIALFGILRAGCIVVNVNPLYTARELEHQLIDSGAKVIIIVANFARTLAQVIEKTKVEKVVLTELGDMLDFPKSMLVNFVVKRIKKIVPAFNLPGAIAFTTALKKGAQSKYARPSVKHEDLGFLQYTGGTTGVSKGAMLTHGNIVANMVQARAWIRNSLKEGEEIIITPLPLYHIFSLTANCFIFPPTDVWCLFTIASALSISASMISCISSCNSFFCAGVMAKLRIW